MKVSDFHFDLPEELIAKFPLEKRSASRLLALPRGKKPEHKQFTDLIEFLAPGDVLVFNNTRVVPARLYGKKETGGRVEVLIERVLEPKQALAHVGASRAPKQGSQLTLEGGIQVEVLGRQKNLFILKLISGAQDWFEAMDISGHMPLPPYIDRPDEKADQERYQTVYAQEKGAVAAPTAGLHFDEQLMQQLEDYGIQKVFVTLHVGAGTFQPVKVDSVDEHVMHSEWLEVNQAAVDTIQSARAKGNKVVAVGTTSVRSLETAAKHSQGNQLTPYRGDTDIFIYPGYEFQIVDALITNFHLPESTLIMLVSALAGQARIMSAYKEAVENKYRFFSYGDAMFIESNQS